MTLYYELDAVPQGRPLFANRVAIDPPKSAKFKKDIAILTLAQIDPEAEPLENCAIRVTVEVYRNFQNTTHPWYGDIDNLVKSILDGITQSGAVWTDDRFITELHVFKYISKNPHIVVEVKRE